MADNAPKLYEGLFLLNPHQLASDPSATVAQLQELLGRVNAKVHALRKWEERKLAYPIKGQKRGTYYIVWFDAAPSDLAQLERDCNLSETIVRQMVIRMDHYGPQELKDAIDGKLTWHSTPVADAPVAPVADVDIEDED